MTTDNFCFYLINRLFQNSQIGGQQYSDTSSFSIPWLIYPASFFQATREQGWKRGNLTEGFSTVDLLVLTGLDQLIFWLKIIFPLFAKQATLMRRSTVLSLTP